MRIRQFHRATAVALSVITALLLASCGQPEQGPAIVEQTPDVLPTAEQPLAQPTPSADVPTQEPSDTPEPTESVKPSQTAEPDGIPDPKDTPAPKRTYEEWKKVNADVIGWIKIADTNIDYPVVIGKDNEYYLTHGPDKKSSKSGAVFMDYRIAEELKPRHLIIYGHNMRNETQFNHLNKFKDKAFFDKHPTFTFKYGDDEYDCQVFSAYVTTLDIVFTHVKFGSPQNFVNYMADLKKQSKYANDIKIGENDQVLTLVTCTYEYDNSRYVVHAKVGKKKK